ncbi:MAG TPA: DUF1736 domain-containing protein [Bryobacterales bacterium]|nr:DUF1736 domain-containing protein [Bryobacterales bacterium]
MARAKNKGRGAPAASPGAAKAKPTPAATPWLARPRVLAGLVFAAAVAVYLNSLGGDFVFDDTSLVEHNPLLHSLGFANLARIFGSHYWQAVEGHGGLYRPIVVLSYAINYALGGLHPWGYHLVNLLIHAANAALVFFLIAELFADRTFALWSGLLFALHPIRTEGVAYIAGRTESLAALFFLLAWWLYLRPERRFVAFAALAFFLAVLSKESAFTFLAVPPLTDYVLRRRPDPLRYAALAAAAAAALGLRYVVLGGFAPLYINPASNPLAHAALATRLLTAAVVLGKYLWLLLFPIPLSADYSFNQIPLVAHPADPWFLLSAAALLALCAAALCAFLRGARAWFFCLAFFLATFSIASNFLRPIGTIMAERLLYLPSLGFTCAIAYAIARAQQAPRRREAATAFAILLALFYAGRTVLRNADWHDHLALFSSAAVVSSDSSLVQANYANALLYQARDAAAAAEHARAALRIDPSDPAATMTLADAYQALGDLHRAAEAYAQVERLAPGTPGAQEAARRRATILHALPH